MTDFDIRGVDEVQRLLSKVEGPALKKTLQKATNASAKFLKPKVQAAAPRRSGKLRKSISAGQARRDRPSAIVKARPKVAFYRHMVTGGTKPHRIRFPDQKAAGVPKSEGNIKHPGAKAKPFIEETSRQYRDGAVDAALDVIRKELDT